MGNRQIPEKIHPGRNRLTINLTQSELAQTVSLLKSSVELLCSQKNMNSFGAAETQDIYSAALSKCRPSSSSPQWQLPVVKPAVGPKTHQASGLWNDPSVNQSKTGGEFGLHSLENIRHTPTSAFDQHILPDQLYPEDVTPQDSTSHIITPSPAILQQSLGRELMEELGWANGEISHNDTHDFPGRTVTASGISHYGSSQQSSLSSGLQWGNEESIEFTHRFVPKENGLPSRSQAAQGIGKERSKSSMNGIALGPIGTRPPQQKKSVHEAVQDLSKATVGLRINNSANSLASPQHSNTAMLKTDMVGFGNAVNGHITTNIAEKAKVGSKPLLQKPGLVSSSWKGCYKTAPIEHNHERITSMIYSPTFEGLATGGRNTGWLISSSSKLLNLWECTQQANLTPQLQVMHSLATDFTMESMDLDLNSRLLIAYCTQAGSLKSVITLHTLEAATFFKYKGMFSVPVGMTDGFKNESFLSLMHVISLQPFGGPLSSSFAVCNRGNILVYELAAAVKSTTSNTVAPKAVWSAHSLPITCMSRSPFTTSILTGAYDGLVRLWDMKTKPNAPVSQFVHEKAITGVSMLDANMMSSCGTDGSIKFWDLRSATIALHSVIPDGKPILNMALSRPADALALTTKQGMYSLEFGKRDFSSILTPFTPLPPAGPCADLKWNTKSKDVYASGVDGSIYVFRKSS